jgi:hypothetical protein
MRRDLNVELFDIALLGGTMEGRLGSNERSQAEIFPTVPFCPMLSQSWSFLRARSVKLPKVLAEAGRNLLPGLWTTFSAEGMAILRTKIELGTKR